MTRTLLRRYWRMLLAAGVLATLVGIVHASIPDSGGVVNACYQNNNGALRVVDNPATCKNNETPLAWSQTGPQGLQGPQGAQGIQGPQGFPGPQGPQGPSGASIGSNFYASYDSQRIEEDDSRSHQKDVEIVGVSDVAGGTYLINGTVKIQFDSCTFCVGDPIVQCYFEDQAGEFFDGYTVTGNLSGHDDQAVYSLTTVRTFPNPPNTIGVICGSYDRASTASGQINTTRVNPLGVK